VALLAIITVGSLGVAVGFHQLLIAILVIEVVIALAARVLFLEPGAALAKDAEVVIRELEIIFGLDAVARELRVTRHALVFLEELRGVTALAIVLPVPRLSTEVLTPLSPTTAPAAALSLIDQIRLP